MMLYICTKSRENTSNRFRVMARTRKADGRTTKGHNSVKNVGGVMVLVLCTSSDDVLYLYKVSRKYLKPFPSYGPDTKKLTDGQTDGRTR